MKATYIFFLLGLATLTLSCTSDDDDNNFVDEPTFRANFLYYDSGNITGPLLEPGTYELAISFTADDLEPHVGKTIEEVRFFVGPQFPKSCKVKIYTGGSSTPSTLLYEANVTNALESTTFNVHEVAQPITISTQPIWISVEVEHDINQQSIGCDDGPRKTGGDWLLQSQDNQWRSYADRTNESINWNIRMKLSE